MSSIETYALPIIDKPPVAAVDTALVMRVLEPIWHAKTETASRVRRRIEGVLDYAKVDRLRDGENPARRKGHLEYRLLKKSKTAPVVHFAAPPYREITGFLADLRQRDGVGMRALELMILCASRLGEVLKARWSEFKRKERLCG